MATTLSHSLASMLYFLLILQLLPASTAQEWGPKNGNYELIDDYSPSNFFDMFTFNTTYDYFKSQGFVQYLDYPNASDHGLVGPGSDGHSVYIGVDHTNTIPINYNPPDGGKFFDQIDGRPSVKLVSNAVYTHGLFVFDVQHVPVGCGVWPAIWTVKDAGWPAFGEIDVFETWNNMAYNTMTLHTNGTCLDAGGHETGTLMGNDCSDPMGTGYSGCGVQDNNPKSAGDVFNTNGGGVWVMEWTSQFIRIWFFPRQSVPSSITDGKPDPDTFGPAFEYELPAANFQSYPNGSCLIDDHFSDHNIVIDIDFCGQLAGNLFCDATCSSATSKAHCGPYNATLPGHYVPDTSKEQCAIFVSENPGAFLDAYFEINSIKVYQQRKKPAYIGVWPTTTLEPVFTSWYHPGQGGKAAPTIPPGYGWRWNP